MSKTAVYSWRLSAPLKRALEDAARESRESVAELLERIVREWLASSAVADDEQEQDRRQAAAARCFGKIRGNDPDRAAKASEAIRTRLAQRHDRLS